MKITVRFTQFTWTHTTFLFIINYNKYCFVTEHSLSIMSGYPVYTAVYPALTFLYLLKFSASQHDWQF